MILVCKNKSDGNIIAKNYSSLAVMKKYEIVGKEHAVIKTLLAIT